MKVSYETALYGHSDERLQVKGCQAGRADIVCWCGDFNVNFMDSYEVPHVFVSDQVEEGGRKLEQWP